MVVVASVRVVGVASIHVLDAAGQNGIELLRRRLVCGICSGHCRVAAADRKSIGDRIAGSYSERDDVESHRRIVVVVLFAISLEAEGEGMSTLLVGDIIGEAEERVELPSRQ